MTVFNIVIYIFAAILVIIMIAGYIKDHFINRKSKSDVDEFYEEQKSPELTRVRTESISSSSRNTDAVYQHDNNSENESFADNADDETSDENDDTDDDEVRSKFEEANRELLMHHLMDMGCQPELTEENHVTVSYQGENFLIMSNGIYFRIWDLNWLSVNMQDDEYFIMKDAANYANFSFGPTIVMHAPDEGGNIYISSRYDVLFSNEIKDRTAYLRSVLDAFFSLKHIMYHEFQRIKENPQYQTINPTGQGFDPSSLSDLKYPQSN